MYKKYFFSYRFSDDGTPDIDAGMCSWLDLKDHYDLQNHLRGLESFTLKF